MNILGVIIARGGSKGVPGKNIKLLAGKPLISYSIKIENANLNTGPTNVSLIGNAASSLLVFTRYTKQIMGSIETNSLKKKAFPAPTSNANEEYSSVNVEPGPNPNSSL